MKDHFIEDKISILMPVYNAMPYLSACVDSIISQSYSNWELIAVDDFSTDNSLDVLRAFAQKDQRITVLPNIDKGIIPALELAYSHSTGSLISRMDADDLMVPSKLQLLAQAQKKHPTSCITAKVKYFSETVLQDGYKRYESWLNRLIDKENHYKSIYKECVVPSPCWLLSREIIDTIGGITSGRYPEDYDMCFRLYQHKIPINGISDTIHLWRDHGTRASRNDPHYKDQHFIPLKLHYFKKLDLQDDCTLIVWGGGKTGKLWAKALQESSISFRWITGSKNKIGHVIYDVLLESDEILHGIENTQIIVAIKEQGFEEKNGTLLHTLQRSNTFFYMY